MLRRLKFFGVGAFISIIVLSIGDNNRIKNTLDSNFDYFNPDKRVINQFLLADSKIYLVSDKLEINSFLNKAWVNHRMTNKDSYPQIFVLDNFSGSQNQRLHCRYYDMEKRKEGGKLKRYSKLEFVKFEKGIHISSRSYNSYFYLIGIFLLIMIPVSLLARNLISKRRVQSELNEEIITIILIILFIIFNVVK